PLQTTFDLPEHETNLFDHLNEVKVLDSTTLSSSLFNQFTFAFRQDRQDKTSVTDAPGILVPGAFNGGGAQSDRHPRETAAHLQDSVSLGMGRHTFGFGGGVRLRFLRLFDDGNFVGTYQFASLEDYANRNPFLFTRNFGNPLVEYHVHDTYGFVQDEIRL